MRDFVRPDVLKNAGFAAAATAFACYSRLALWFDRPDRLAFLVTLIFVSSFMLWGAVFAWHEKYSRREVMNFEWDPALWGTVTACGLIAAVSTRLFIDPTLRPLLPENYTDSIGKLAAMTLFTAAFTQLFLCFAPMAFFLRLFKSTAQAVLLTVLAGVFAAFLKVGSLEMPLLFLLCVLAVRGLSGYLGVYFYLRGGALAVWWWTILLESRHLADLVSN